MHDFILASIGGVLIGMAAVLLMATQGSVMGISGILSRLIPPTAPDWTWRLVFMAGVLSAPLLVFLIAGYQVPVGVTANLLLIIPAGLLVGAGTVIGNGCTSGHGVCGLSRFSLRSVIATVLFVSAGVITVYLVQKLSGRG